MKGESRSIPAQVPDLPPLRLPVWFRSQQPTHLESSASYRVSVRNLAGLGGNVADNEMMGLAFC